MFMFASFSLQLAYSVGLFVFLASQELETDDMNPHDA